MIFMQVPGLPLSVNHAYEDNVIVKTGKKGRRKYIVNRKLSEEGDAYKQETSTYLSRYFPEEMQIMKPNVSLGMAILLDMPDIFNKGWPEKAKTRYKKLDVSNRVKLLEDAIAHAGGIDDSQFVNVMSAKRQGAEQTSIWIWNADEEGLIPYALAGSPVYPAPAGV
jgi:Holliday junction resolvase RusA-like endonuclease